MELGVEEYTDAFSSQSLFPLALALETMLALLALRTIACRCISKSRGSFFTKLGDAPSEPIGRLLGDVLVTEAAAAAAAAARRARLPARSSSNRWGRGRRCVRS